MIGSFLNRRFSLPLRTLAIFYVIFLLFLYVAYSFAITPTGKQIARKRAEVQAIERQLQNSEEEQEALARLRVEEERVNYEIQQYQVRIPSEVTQESIIALVDRIANDSGVEVERISLGESAPYISNSDGMTNIYVNSLYRTPIVIEVKGNWASFHTLIHLFHFETSGLFQIRSMTITPAQGSNVETTMQMRLVVHYVYRKGGV